MNENRLWLDKWIEKGHRFALATPRSELGTEFVKGQPNGNSPLRKIRYLESKNITIDDWSDLIQ